MGHNHNTKKNEDMEDWRNEHGQPSIVYLQSLVDDGGSAALAKLQSIASDLNVNYERDTPVDELIRNIESATRNDPDTTT